jgi:tetratricopeptide (TPR) repeat protein
VPPGETGAQKDSGQPRPTAVPAEDETRLGFEQPAAQRADAEVTGFGASLPPDPDLTGLGAAANPDSDQTRLGAAPMPSGLGDDAGAAPRPLPRAATAGAGVATPVPGRTPLPGRTRASRTRVTAGGGAASTTGPLDPGEAFGSRYHIIRVLGIGGMGAVYQAWDAELEVALALKVIRPDVTDDPATAAEIERRFKRELLLARQVTHPNVVRIHDLGEIEGIKYITMPYVQGRDLSDILTESGALPVSRALNVARQVAAGLCAAHDAGVVHRDLKPANIMITAEDRALIMDFGIARTVTGPAEEQGGVTRAGDAGATRVGAVVGTVEYMAPEQARGKPVDQRADIYAFGLILSRMLVGKQLMPGAKDAYTDLMARLEQAPPRVRTIDASIPEAVDAIVARCLEPDPAARFQNTAELLAALEALDENGIPKPEPPRLLRSWKFWAAAAAVVAGLMLGTWRVALSYLVRGVEPQRDPVAVLVGDFENRTGDTVFDGLLEQSLGVGIEGASFITTLQRQAALRIARQIKAGDQLDERAARLVAMREGIKVLLAGSVEPRGRGYLVKVRGLEPQSGQQVLAAEAEAADRDAVLTAAATLAARVRSALGDTRTPDASETFSAASLEAVADYVKAQHLSVSGRDDEAIEFYKRATERDPTFGRALGGWATALTRLGRREEADAVWKQALSQLDRMSERERYRMLGAYYTLVTRNYDKALETYAALVKQYPADGAGHNNLAVGYFRKLDFQRAREEGQRVLQIYPNSPLYRTNYALYAMYAGDFETAKREAQRLVDDGAASFDAYLPLAVAAVAAADLGAARAAYEAMAGVGPAGTSLSAIGLADLALYEGRPRDAAAHLTAGIALDQKADNQAGVAQKQLVLAETMVAQGQLVEAALLARKVAEADESDASRVMAARLSIAAGRDAEAVEIGARLDNRLELQSRAYGRTVAAQVALLKGRRAEAVDALRDALKLADLWLVRFTLGQAFLDAGYHAEALSEFEACLERRGEASALFLDDVPTLRYTAVLPYWIGRAQEGLGLLPQAQEHYRQFLAPMAPDSPDPLVRDARKRLGS